MTEMRKVTLIVHGRVQGVFYRDSTMRKARELGLTGYVRNLPEGTVEIVAQGPLRILEDLIRWAHDGPPAAVVSKVEVYYGTVEQGMDGFKVSY